MKKFIYLTLLLTVLIILVSCKKTSAFSEQDIRDAIKIGFADGDEKRYVIHNLDLPTSIDLDEEIKIEWFSLYPQVITETGIVRRKDSDVHVVLTYHVSYLDIDFYENIRVTVIGLNDSSVYVITFDSDGGNKIDNQLVLEGDKILKPADPVREGYAFLGWYASKSFIRTFNFDVMPSGNVTVYARWQYIDDNSYTIIFDTNGGNFIESISANGGAPIEPPSDPVKEGYSFVGWYSDPDLIYPIEIKFMTYGDFTVYAKWVESIDYGNYYKDLEDLVGDELLETLYTIINNTGTYTTTTYGEARDYLAISDVLTTDNTKLDMIYSTTLSSGSYALASWDSGATWNREHVWAKSLLGNGYSVDNGDRGIAADLHNLRAADTGINSSRGNKLFSASTTLLGTYGDDGSGRWYPGDSYIGDVARIIFYMDIRWGSETSIYSIGTLETFIIWNELDPVDTFEKNRNDVIYSYQGNRNPFIDHPELVDLIYG